MANIFNIRYNDLTATLLPTFMRKGLIPALARAFVAPLVTLYYDFLLRRDNNLYALGVTGQVCSLRRMLNEAFPEAEGKIRIEGSEQIAYSLHVPDRDVDVAPAEYLKVYHNKSLQAWNSENILAGSNKFFVYLPAKIYDNKNSRRRATSLLEQYKLVSKLPQLKRDSAA